MSQPTRNQTSLDDWIACESIAFALDRHETLQAAVDRLVASLGKAVQLLGFGEALHGGEEILIMRNRLFQHLVESHGFIAIAVESSFPRGRLVNEYIAGRGERFEEVQEIGFSHGFGRLAANRELVEWMRSYNAACDDGARLQFYGFDSPTEMTVSDSPRQLLQFALDCLAEMESSSAAERRQRINLLLGQDADWENPAAAFDPSKAIGLSPAATALRIETEDLITELRLQHPGQGAGCDNSRYHEALQYARLARQMLCYHAALARQSNDRLAELLGIRDLMMADNLAYVVSRQRGGGRVLSFAHNTHLKRGQARWQLGPHALAWWPAGAHLHEMLGPRYAVIGSAVGVSEGNGIGTPEPGTLEARLTSVSGPVRFISTRRGQRQPAATFAELPVRSGSRKNSTYFPLTPDSLIELDALAVFDSITYNRGGPPLP